MGTGKTTVARALSEKTGRKLIEMDKLIEFQVGKSIFEIFADEGEAFFRSIEKEMLKKIIDEKDLIVSTGGGTLIDEENFQSVQKKGIIILLWAKPEVIFNRLKNENIRPLLSGENKQAKILSLLNERKVQYNRFKYSINTSACSVQDVVCEILKIIQGEINDNNRNAN